VRVLNSHLGVCSEKIGVSAKIYLKIDTLACEFKLEKAASTIF
jgi:hypothetical protein